MRVTFATADARWGEGDVVGLNSNTTTWNWTEMVKWDGNLVCIQVTFTNDAPSYETFKFISLFLPFFSVQHN
jgi:hypothetical protein